MSTVELQIAERARKFRGEALHNLHHFIDLPMLEEGYKQLNRQSAKGVDKVTWQDYGEGLNERLENLLKGFKSGRGNEPLYPEERNNFNGVHTKADE